MTPARLVRGGTALGVATVVLLMAPAALAAKLKLESSGIGLLPAGTVLYLHSGNSKAGEESCVSVDLQGELLTNNKGTDKMRVLTGTATGCSAGSVGAISTVFGGFPWKVNLKWPGSFVFKGTPRLEWEDTFVPPPSVCKYKAQNASNPGTFPVSTTLQPLLLTISPPWPIVPFGSSPLCGAGVLEGSFDAEVERPETLTREAVEVVN